MVEQAKRVDADKCDISSLVRARVLNPRAHVVRDKIPVSSIGPISVKGQCRGWGRGKEGDYSPRVRQQLSAHNGNFWSLYELSSELYTKFSKNVKPFSYCTPRPRSSIFKIWSSVHTSVISRSMKNYVRTSVHGRTTPKLKYEREKTLFLVFISYYAFSSVHII